MNSSPIVGSIATALDSSGHPSPDVVVILPFSLLVAALPSLKAAAQNFEPGLRNKKLRKHRLRAVVEALGLALGARLTINHLSSWRSALHRFPFDERGSLALSHFVDFVNQNGNYERFEQFMKFVGSPTIPLTEEQLERVHQTWALAAKGPFPTPQELESSRQEKLAAQASQREASRAREAANAEIRRVQAAALQAEKLQQRDRAKAAYLSALKAQITNKQVDLVTFDGWACVYNVKFNGRLSVAMLTREAGLSPANAEGLNAQIDARNALQKALRQEMAAEAAALVLWHRSLVPSFEIPDRLIIKKSEYDRWKADGRLEVALYRPFRKWGKSLDLPFFDPVVLAKITPKVLAKWRAADLKLATANRKAGAKNGLAQSLTTRSLKKALKLHAYEMDFTAARQMSRTVHLCTGPTNSGKTHAALQSLIQAKSGVYLAPLRLLALEGYERLKAAGVPVNLLTGEERHFNPAAMHTCSTIEMCDYETPVDVAVIDEIQMLADPRGWAWTAALIGVPAQVVYACGAAHAGASVRELMTNTGDVVTETSFDRKNPLSVMDRSVSLHEVEPGDALVAFSRREVLQFAHLLRRRGLAVSVIYGALSPEVRRVQVQAFIEGKTQVVVATDAIGMGLNLPIRRMIFTETRKFDGVSMRNLLPVELQQIAGRAGRFSLHDEGWVGAFGGADLTRISKGLATPAPQVTAPYPVMPTWQHVQTAMRELKTKDVATALDFFDRISFGGIFGKADLAPVIAKARFVQCEHLSARAIFRLACAPADIDNDRDRSMIDAAIRAMVTGETLSRPLCEVALDGGKPSAYALERAEAHSRKLALFCWLGCAFPGLADLEGLSEHRQTLTDFINRALLSQTGDLLKARKKRYGWKQAECDIFDGDEGCP